MNDTPPQSSLHLVDPALRPLLEAFPTIEFSMDMLPLIRGTPFSMLPDPEAEAAVDLDVVAIPGPPGAPTVGVRLYTPKSRQGVLPCLLHIHGGGYVVGTAAAQDPVHRRLALDAGCIIVSVEYRLAPETKFPGSVEDCYAALRWITAQATPLGLDPKRIGVIGESAGGGLAAALALLVRDRGELSLAFQHLVYPMLDDRTVTSTEPHPFAGEYIWTPHNNAFGWSCLLDVPPGAPGVSPYAAAARAADLSGLPPAFISTGALDLFIDEDVDYARRLSRAGVPVELHVYPGAIHAFDLAPDVEIADTARRDSLAALKRALHRTG